MLALLIMTALSGNTSCVTSWGEARYRNYGYDHLVHIKNGCRQAAVCKVSTDVNPAAVERVVGAGKRTTVLTFRGSPSRRFTPKVVCRLKR
jgi:hypothetical protein